MKRIFKKIKHALFGVQYRLTVIEGEKWINTYSLNRRQLDGAKKDAVYWAMYKRGPLCLPERQIDCSMWREDEL